MPFEEIEQGTRIARNYYKKFKNKVIEAAKKTGLWLKNNEEFYGPDNSREDGNWWGGLTPSSDPVLIDLRDFVFRCHLFDNGIRRMMAELKKLDALPFKGTLADELSFAVSYPVMGLHHELMGYVASGSDRSIKLSDLADRFDLTNAVHLRDRRLVSMSQLGMWKCNATELGYQITLGLPAEEFHRRAFQPIKAAFQPATGGFAASDVHFPD